MSRLTDDHFAEASKMVEPFGYFRAEPFGWTECAPDDEGAVALYERPHHSEDKLEMVVPEGWMQDEKEVRKLQCHLESIGWQPDGDGNPVCSDQAAAMSADVIRLVLLPLLASQKEQQS